jgi:prepilin-type N-terminal cleavage/methylation domain-containing protein
MLFHATRPQLKMARGFSLAEVLIAIVIITILTIGSLAVYSAQLGRARDTERMNDISRLSLLINQFTGDYGSPPSAELVTRRLKDATAKTACTTEAGLYKCFEALKLSSKEDLLEMFFDPLDGVTVPGSSKEYNYAYEADKNSYAICAILEDQGSSNINADPTGKAFSNGGTKASNNENLACIYYTPVGANQIVTVSPLTDAVASTTP